MKTKSIWGNPPTRLYNLVNLLEKEYKGKATACIVGCSDGKFLMPFARKNINVVGYDVDDVALYGGEKDFPIRNTKEKYKYSKDFVSKEYTLETRKVMGTLERLKIEELESFATVEKRDFYKNTPNEKFELVFTSCSQHYSLNQDYTLEEKTKKLQSIVKNGGYIYLDYMMAIDEQDYEKYPSSKFYRKGEIRNYFDESWEIISLTENNQPSFEAAHVDCVVDHFHRFGYIFAKKRG